MYNILDRKIELQNLELVNKIFVLEALLYLLEISLNSKTLKANSIDLLPKEELLWIEQKNHIASQEAREIDQLIETKINLLNQEKKRKKRAVFSQYAFDKYDDLYKALS